MPLGRSISLMTSPLEKMTLHKFGCWMSLILILSASCNCRALELPKNVNKGSEVESGAATKGDFFYQLDLSKPSIAQPIEPRDLVQEGVKFLQIEVTEVVNPKKYPLSFKVHYQSGRGEKIYLGSFSLYPADNPGKFIVATQGKLKNEGAIVLSLEVPDKTDATDIVKVKIKRIRFLKR